MAEIYRLGTKLNANDNYFVFITPNSQVLEIGSASGYVTDFLTNNFGCQVTCIEKNPEMAEQGRGFAKKMIVADVEEDNWEKELSGEFDFIIFADVLEHLRKPSEVLKRVIPFLKKDGFILTSIPNIGHNAVIMNLRNGKFEYQETGLLDDTHIHFFTRESVMKCFYENGFFLAGENDKEIRPCYTESEVFYAKNPLLALSLINKVDAHTYRFVQKWSRNQSDEINLSRSYRLPFGRRVFELFFDFFCLIKRKFNLKTPKIISKLIFKE